jgi:hypothetical protein
MRRSLIAVLAATAGLVGVYVPSASAATVVNGTFETGNLQGWTTDAARGATGISDWYAYSGTAGPATGLFVPAPPQGTFGAVADHDEPSSLVMYQDIALEAGQRHILDLLVYYRNNAANFFTPNSLETADDPNQQYRIDVMNPGAPIRSVAPSDIFVPVFQTRPGDPNALDPFAVRADLSSLAGRTVRLRFASVSTEFFLRSATDAVTLTSTPLVAQPTARCAGRDATIVGTDGNDVLVGTSGKDVIAGLKGKDTLRGRGGNDRLCGKAGKDLLKGGGGNDRLRGGDGKDTLKGGGGNDACKGGPGRDTDQSC